MKDWPLALCDPRSINVEADLEPCDLVYPDYVVENRQLYWAEHQEWWWCSNQTEDEAWIFLQSDTSNNSKPGEPRLPEPKINAKHHAVPHTAFQLQNNAAEPRESIELRALVYYDDVQALTEGL